MKRLLIFLAIFVLASTDTGSQDSCSSKFEQFLVKECSKFSSTSDICTYSANKCHKLYNSCTDYKPSSDFDASICTSITLSNNLKKCVANGNECKEVDKDCSDGENDSTNCLRYSAGTDKRCIYFPETGKCEAHYDDCAKVTSNQNDCKSNIPKGYLNKCEWDSTKTTKCQLTLRTCQDGVINYYDKNNEATKSCFDLYAGDDQRCILLSDGKTCQSHYELCSKAPSDKCENNIPKDKTKNCAWGKDICVDSNRKCEDGLADFTEKDPQTGKTCFDLGHTDKQRCVKLSDGTCKTHYNSCSDITQSSTCDDNYPSTGKDKRCKWEKVENEDKCVEKTRYCEDYLYSNYQDSQNDLTTPLPCISLLGTSTTLASSDSKKVCMLIEKDGKKTCKSEYSSCSQGDNDKDLCETIKPLYSPRTQYKPNYKCSYEGTSCTEKLKDCNEYDEENNDQCTALNPLNNYQSCVYDSDKKNCVSKYRKCEDYNSDVTEAAQRTKSICENIILDQTNAPYKKCVFDDTGNKNECKTETKPCSELKDKTTCHAQTFDDEDRLCLFISGTCVESLKTCSSEGANSNKTFCERIEPPYDYTKGEYYNCTFSQEGNEKKCEAKKVQCNDYKTRVRETYYCYSLTNQIESNTDNKFYCVERNDKCTKEYTQCEKYDGNEKTECESIILSYYYNKRCAFDASKSPKCQTVDKLCDEYTGNDESTCQTYKASSENKKCVFDNNKCVEKYTQCTDYKGTDSGECETIKPYYDDYDYVDKTSKCVYNSGCKKVKMGCSEMKDEDDCERLTPTDTKKQCVFINNKCEEQYKTCNLYYSNEATITKETCEKIRIYDETNNHNYPVYYCQYTAPGSGETKGKCESKQKRCDEFNIDNYKDYCETDKDVFPADRDLDKCVYSNKICTTKAKTCLEMDHLSNVNKDEVKDVCKNRATSSGNYYCEANEDLDGCVEKQKSSAGEKRLSKIILALLFCLLA